MTKKELEEKSDVDLVLMILSERKRHVTPYSPLGVRLDSIISNLYWKRKIDDKVKEGKIVSTVERKFYRIIVWENQNDIGDTLNEEYADQADAMQAYSKLIDSYKYESVVLREVEEWSGGSCSTPIRIWGKGKWGVYDRYTGKIVEGGLGFAEAQRYINSKPNPSNYEIYEK